ncbi:MULTISPECIES: SdrD B-like domain-containing protein [Actinosynnema]|uniref:SdrD B-like domain-containing protein n=1 Tax=Actinosynnema TaxID=40566 RepID=UPI0020A54A62|nr:SdrD B-like domain-containing protein [Actinosynnema pretiosum]
MRRWRAACGAVAAAALVGTGAAAGPAHAQDAGEIAGTVWIDKDQDRQPGEHEARRAGVTVTALQRSTGERRTATTDERGDFRFTGLPLGAYEVEADRTGYATLADRTWDVELTSGSPRAGQAWFPQQGGTLGGQASVDADDDGARDANPERVAVTVHLWGRDLTGAEVRASTTTSDYGWYHFDALATGVYQVRAEVPQGYRLARPNAGAGSSGAHTDFDLLGADATSLPVRFAETGSRYAAVDIGLVRGEGVASEPVLVNAASGWCADQEMPGGAVTAGVAAGDCHGGDNQRWKPRWVEPDVVELVDARTGFCLDQEFPGGRRTSGVGAYRCHGGANQRWRVSHDEQGGEPFTAVNLATGECLDQEYPTGTPTTGVGAYRCHGGANQSWVAR